MPDIKEAHRARSKLAIAAHEHDERNSPKKAREYPSCKKRPNSKKAAKGNGGSKKFVPWC
jgi:hypothetical protein